MKKLGLVKLTGLTPSERAELLKLIANDGWQILAVGTDGDDCYALVNELIEHFRDVCLEDVDYD